MRNHHLLRNTGAHTLYAAFFLTISLLALNCSDDDDEGLLLAPQSRSISQIARTDTALSTLESALDTAGLTATLGEEGPFTLFAPTNAAFDALPPGTLDSLLANADTELRNLLLYHVTEGELRSTDLADLDSVTTLEGSAVSISRQDGGIVLNDSIMVVGADMEAANGIIHKIDAVLIPPDE
ncbi:MAG: fasciclin domain-containing protein [Chitinivibrionales bacterium]|nr:fasciclin domain-containing protein [Chitinivibrionales bacterium]MBD3358886.1 fasciclin domain-containing protein [Chitinivibrionales bacterium]